MRWLRRFSRRTDAEADLDAEIRFHLEEEARLRVERGEAPAAARASAVRLFGNVTRVQETTREMWAWSRLASAWRAVSLILRSFIDARGFAMAAMLTVALGIGANTMAFSMFDRVLFRPLPYADPDRLVQIQTRDGPLAVNGPDGATLDVAIMLALAQEPGLFTGIAWASGGNWLNGGGAVPMTPVAGANPELWLTSVTWNALDVLGVRPVIGPGFSDEVRADAARPVLLTYDTWQRRYGGTDDVLSRSWTAPDLASSASAAQWRVVGVLPKGFLLPTSRSLRGEYDGIVGIDPRLDRQPPSLPTIGVALFARLAPGVTIAAARARANTLVTLAFGRANVTIEPLQAGMGVAVRPYVWLAVAGAWAVLAATCLTLAMLLLTWSHSRRHAAGVRLALGASPRRLVLTAVLESVVLCGAGALTGWLACEWTRSFVMSAVPLGLRPFVAEAVDIRVVAVTCGIAIATAAAAGALPASRISRVAPLDVMRRRRDASILDRLEGGPVLLAVQAAFGVMLLVGAWATVPAVLGATLKSPGFDAADLFRLGVPTSDDESADNALEQVRRGMAAKDVISRIPGVADVGLASDTPFHMRALDRIGGGWKRLVPPGFDGRVIGVDAEFFRALGTPILAGRAFSPAEIQQQALVAIVTESAARAFWPDAPPAAALGRTVATFDGPAAVVGVTADIRRELDVRPDPILFLPLSAKIFYRSVNAYPWNSFDVFVRMAPGRVPDPVLIRQELQREPWVLPDWRGVPLWSSVAAELEPVVEKPRLLAAVFGSLGLIILVLTTIAVYGLASFEVRRRRDEMTVRLALGATPWALRRRLAGAITMPVLVGTLIGLPFGWVEVKLISRSLPLVHPNDVRIYAGAAGAMLLAALIAAWLPGRRLKTMRVADLRRD